MPAILIVDDLISIHEMLEAIIQPTGYTTAFATDGEKALVRYRAEKFDLVLADIDMKPMDGITLLKQLKLYDPSVVVIIMTAYASTESAIQALKYGTFDYLQKPFKVDELIHTLKRAIEFKRVASERESLAGSRAQVSASDFEARLPGSSPAMKRLIFQLKKLATANTPVLITGELGTGHEIAADLLHSAGDPTGSAMVSIDCQVCTPEMIRDGLIGPEGTGGKWVQQARGGTLFLQHVHCLRKETQQSLVAVVRNNTHQLRLVCSTEADLEKLTEEGRFNEELFYRIAALPVQLPPLRERLQDLPVLLKEIAFHTVNPRFDVRQIEFKDDAMAVLRAYRWSGNQAELNQVVSQVISCSETKTISAAQLPQRIQALKGWPTLSDFISAQEKQYLSTVLQACDGDKFKAAKTLGIDPARFG